MGYEIGRARPVESSWIAQTLLDFLVEISGQESTLAASDDARERINADIGSWLVDPYRVIFIARDGDTPVGLAHAQIWRLPPLYVGRNEIFVNEIYVVPAYRTRKIGTSLVQSVLEWAKTKQVEGLRATVLASSSAATSFWNSIGARPITTDYAIDINQEVSKSTKKRVKLGF